MPSVLVGDRSITYSVAGSGLPVVFVHGSFGASSVWRRLIARLDPQRLRTVTLDLPGWGASDPPPHEGSVLEHEAAALEAVASNAIGEPVHLVAHSHGGVVGLMVALAAHISLRSLTLFEPLPLGILAEAGHDDALSEMTTFLKDYRSAFDADDHWAVRRVIDLWGEPGSFAAMSPSSRDSVAAGTAQNIRQWQDNLAHSLPSETCRSLSVPTTIVVSERANRVAQLIGDRLRELIPGSKLIEMAGAGHAMIHTHAVEAAMIVNQAVLCETVP